MPTKTVASAPAGFPGRGIRLHAVSKQYPMAGRPLTALDRVSLDIPQGEFLAIVGKSGSGKSTLLNLLTGIDRPTAGDIWVDGEPIHQLSEGRLAKWRGRQVGVVFQFFQLMPSLTILENVMLPMDFAGQIPARHRPVRARELLERVSVADQAGKLPVMLSGGQQQRAAIARALANDPAVLAADEPTGNLDSATAETVFSLFADLARGGKTILLVTHDREIARRADRIVTLRDGIVVSDVRPEGKAQHE